MESIQSQPEMNHTAPALEELAMQARGSGHYEHLVAAAAARTWHEREVLMSDPEAVAEAAKAREAATVALAVYEVEQGYHPLPPDESH
jgi:hypothetical protein